MFCLEKKTKTFDLRINDGTFFFKVVRGKCLKDFYLIYSSTATEHRSSPSAYNRGHLSIGHNWRTETGVTNCFAQQINMEIKEREA